MTQYNFAFYATEKSRSRNWGAILAKGAAVHGDTVTLVPQTTFAKVPDTYDGGGHIGLSRACKRIMFGYLEAGKHFLFFDKGYWGRNVFWRVSVDGWQPLKYFRRFSRGPDRLAVLEQKFGLTFSERKDKDAEAPIMFAGSCQNYANFFDLGDVNDYNLKILKKLRKHSLRPILYRPNPSWYDKHNDEFKDIHNKVPNTQLSVGGNFIEAIQSCNLMVTHGTAAAVTAIQHGIPALIIGDGVAKSIAMGPDWDKIEEPYFPNGKELQQFYSDLAYCQWTVEEFSNGTAWQEIRDILSFLDGKQSKVSVAEITRQYQVMHASPKYFRGLGTLNYASEIGLQIVTTNSRSVLDYGSGKGEQYQEPYELHKQWGAAVTCYDPGVKEFSKLPPDKKFDGVVCCDVMEHIPDDAVDSVLSDIFSYAKDWVFFVVTTVPAKKNLPDGRNCHVAIHDEQWWYNRIRQRCPSGVKFTLITKGDDSEGE